MAVAEDLRMQLLRVIPDERRVTDGESALDQHAADLSYHEPRRPDVVVYPETTAEVAAVLELADATETPVVPFGAGTSLEGHVIPLHGGISLDLTRMNAILALRADDLTATASSVPKRRSRTGSPTACSSPAPKPPKRRRRAVVRTSPRPPATPE